MPNRAPEDFLEEARRAEKAAEEAQTDRIKEHFRIIAAEYRALAAEKERLDQAGKDPKWDA